MIKTLVFDRRILLASVYDDDVTITRICSYMNTVTLRKRGVEPPNL